MIDHTGEKDSTTGSDIGRLLRDSFEGMDSASKQAIRDRLVNTIRSGRSYRRIRRMWTGVLAVAVSGAALSGVAFAAQGSLPGEPLYVVKRALEDMRLAITPEGLLKETFMLQMAENRTVELQRLLSEGAEDGHVEKAFGTFSETAADVSDLGEDERLQERWQEYQEGAEEALRLTIQEASPELQIRAESELAEQQGGRDDPVEQQSHSRLQSPVSGESIRGEGSTPDLDSDVSQTETGSAGPHGSEQQGGMVP